MNTDRNCSTPVLPPHSELSGGGILAATYPIGHVLQFACVAGYELIPGTISMSACLANSTWAVGPTFCRSISAGAVPSVTVPAQPQPTPPALSPTNAGSPDDATEELPPYPSPSESTEDSVPAYWQTLAIILGVFTGVLLLAVIALSAVTMSAPPRAVPPPAPAPPPPPEVEFSAVPVAEGDLVDEFAT